MNLPQPLGSFESDRLNAICARLGEVRSFLQDHLVGGDALVERLLIGLLANGHILLEGAPGLAKTRAVKLLASALNLTFA
ncbi:MAG: AAA family ATPase, partial [Alphaproteobacteria bacterium]|nr:AAA family ATPase [Alphaproteobacteria bacterium]